jgi:two-component system NtrC family response regulator
MIADARILVADDEAGQRDLLADLLADLGADVRRAANGSEALAEVVRDPPDLVLTDVRMPGVSGAELLAEVKRANPQVEVVLVTAYGDVRDAVAALRAGAADYLLKPLDLDEVECVVRRALERRTLERENRELRRRLGEVESLPGIVTVGGAMAEALSTVARAAPSEAPVLILGESGTGKELIARALHGASRRTRGPFVALHGASLAPALVESELFGHERGAFTGADRLRRGRFEAADGGTLFLDEVGDLPPEVQVKLLRILQERRLERVGSSETIEVDVRIVAATHHDLPRRVRDGLFREDLYYRIAVVVVDLPPLRRRRADVPLLVEHFREKHGAGSGRRSKAGGAGSEPPAFSREAMDLLVAYDYPGNVRELENVVHRALVLTRGPLVTTADLPPAVRGTPSEGGNGFLDETVPLPARVEALERSAIARALAAAGGNQSGAAQDLGISERMLRYKLDKYGLREAKREVQDA